MIDRRQLNKSGNATKVGAILVACQDRFFDHFINHTLLEAGTQIGHKRITQIPLLLLLLHQSEDRRLDPTETKIPRGSLFDF